MPQPNRASANAAAFGLSELGWGFAWALSFEGPMIAAFASGVGRGDADVGLVWLLQSVGLALPMLLTAWLLAPLGRMRGLVAAGHAVAAVLLLALAGIAAWTDPVVLRIAYLAAVPLFFLAIGVQIPAWYAMFGELFAPRGQARVLGFVFAMNRIGALLGGGLAARFLARADTPREAWVGAFGAAGLVGLLGTLAYARVRERGVRPRPRPALRRHLAGVGRSWTRFPAFRRFVIADALGIAQWVVIALFAQAAFARDGHPRWWAGPWTQASAAGMLASCLVVLGLGDRVRPRTWLVSGATVLSCGAILAAVGGGPAIHAVVAATVGWTIGTRVSCVGPTLMRLVPARSRTRALGLQGAIATALQGVFAWGGGRIAASAGYPPVFLAAAALSLVSGLLLLFWVPCPPRVAK